MFGLFGDSGERKKELEARWRKLYRMAYAWCHDTHLASDLVQETLTRGFRSAHKLNDPEALDVWLIRIMLNCWRDHCRRRRTTVGIDEVNLANDSSPEQDTHRTEVQRRVQAAMRELNVQQRQIISLVDFEGYSYAEVTEILEVPMGTVMSRLSRARQALRQYLQDLEPEGSNKNTMIRRVK